MRFGRPPHSQAVLRPASQRQLFKLVALLGFVVMAIQWAAREENWQWMTGFDQPLPPPEIPLQELNFRVHPDAPPPTEPALEMAAPRSSHYHAGAAPPFLTSSETTLPPGLLEGMDDRRLGLLRSERAQIDVILERVRHLTDHQLATAADRNIGFIPLNDRPGDYRGRLLHFDGILWRLSKFHEGAAETPNDDLYEAWLYTPDAGNNPTRVLCTQIDPPLRIGDQVDQPVSFDGYFVKRYGYATETGMHVAPLFVAKAVHGRTGHTPPSQAVKSSEYQWITITGVMAVAGVVIFRLYRQFQQYPERSTPLPDRVPDINIYSLSGVEAETHLGDNPDVSQKLT
ncbi:MAG: hypothetical protein DWH91_08255 [Planctomycetota bacterium]|nr:MAG: hypothetical protein DWH91_08255 [Planctomycetota bacterium]